MELRRKSQTVDLKMLKALLNGEVEPIRNGEGKTMFEQLQELEAPKSEAMKKLDLYINENNLKGSNEAGWAIELLSTLERKEQGISEYKIHKILASHSACLEFLRNTGSDLTYKLFADQMGEAKYKEIFARFADAFKFHQ